MCIGQLYLCAIYSTIAKIRIFLLNQASLASFPAKTCGHDRFQRAHFKVSFLNQSSCFTGKGTAEGGALVLTVLLKQKSKFERCGSAGVHPFNSCDCLKQIAQPSDRLGPSTNRLSEFTLLDVRERIFSKVTVCPLVSCRNVGDHSFVWWPYVNANGNHRPTEGLRPDLKRQHFVGLVLSVNRHDMCTYADSLL